MADQLKVRRLYQDFDNTPGNRAKRQAVEATILQMIAAGDFYLTEHLNQRRGVRQTVIDVLRGQGVSDGSRGRAKWEQEIGLAIPRAIDEHLVQLRALDGKGPITYFHGEQEIEGVVVGGRYGDRDIVQYEKRTHDLGGPEAAARTPVAVLVLLQTGKFVRYAPDRDCQHLAWKCVEVMPEATAAAFKKLGYPIPADAAPGKAARKG